MIAFIYNSLLKKRKNAYAFYYCWQMAHIFLIRVWQIWHEPCMKHRLCVYFAFWIRNFEQITQIIDWYLEKKLRYWTLIVTERCRKQITNQVLINSNNKSYKIKLVHRVQRVCRLSHLSHCRRRYFFFCETRLKKYYITR